MMVRTFSRTSFGLLVFLFDFTQNVLFMKGITHHSLLMASSNAIKLPNTYSIVGVVPQEKRLC